MLFFVQNSRAGFIVGPLEGGRGICVLIMHSKQIEAPNWDSSSGVQFEPGRPSGTPRLRSIAGFLLGFRILGEYFSISATVLSRVCVLGVVVWRFWARFLPVS